MRNSSKKKVIVFDLDETIGHFEELGRFIDGLAALHKGSQFVHSHKTNAFKHITQKHFNDILDMYPEFFRPHIFTIFKELLKYKKQNRHLKVAIYTNNIGPRTWTMYIKKYIERKIGHKLFDKVITGYRPHEKGNCRTTHRKTYKDLVKCMKMSDNTNIVFFDDQYHPKMKHGNIHYVHLRPYNVGINFVDMINHFIKNNDKGVFGDTFVFTPSLSKTQFSNTMYQILEKLGRPHVTYRVKKTKPSKKDLDETRRIKYAIKHFMGKQSKKKRHKTRKRKTRRQPS